MKHRGVVFLLAWAATIFAACSDNGTEVRNDPPVIDVPKAPTKPELPALIISDVGAAQSGNSGSIAISSSFADVSFVSLPPGTLSNVQTVRIRNATSGGPSSAEIDVVAGGFDPVAVTATEGDEIEFTFRDPRGNTTQAFKKVPAKRPPSIVRTNPPKGRTDVVIGSRLAVIFSEPIAALTSANSVTLTTGGAPVPVTIERPAAAPWAVEVIPSQPLRPLTTYQLVITSNVRDLDGDSVQANDTINFATGAQLVTQGRIAFTSNRTGTLEIYVANGDGSGVTRLTAGVNPSWSPDGRRIAFVRADRISEGSPQVASIYAMNADGSGERRLTVGSQPSWSPDGKRIVFADSASISVMNDDGSGVVNLIRRDVRLRSAPGFYVGMPTWSADGKRIVFEYLAEDGRPQALYAMNVDGSDVRPLTGAEASAECKAAFSPDGSTIAFWSFQLGVAFVGSDGRNLVGFYRDFPAVNCAAGPDWSPDGGWLAFSIGKIDADRRWQERIHVMHRNALELHQLIPDVLSFTNPTYSDREVAWSRR